MSHAKDCEIVIDWWDPMSLCSCGEIPKETAIVEKRKKPLDTEILDWLLKNADISHGSAIITNRTEIVAAMIEGKCSENGVYCRRCGRRYLP